MSGPIQSVFTVRGHLIDTGLLTEVLDAIPASGASYEIALFEVGKESEDESEARINVTSPDLEIYHRVRDDLMSLGVSEEGEAPVAIAAVTQTGVAPEGFYSTTNLATEFRLEKAGAWLTVGGQRMDATIVVDKGAGRCVKLRDLAVGEQVVTGMDGIRLKPARKRTQKTSRFTFMSGGVSSERRLGAQMDEIVDAWKSTREAGRKVILVPGPVVVHVGAAEKLAAVIRAGQVDGVLSGNALAVHDCEAAFFGTSLGVRLEDGKPAVHGHMNHMRAINRIRGAGSLPNAVKSGLLKTGAMHALVETNTPYSLVGSIRDDGPLPDTEMDLLAGQAAYAKILEGAGLVVILASMLHGIGVGNMVPAEVMTVCVDIHPAVVAKLADRGSAQSKGIVTDVGAFLDHLQRRLA